MFINNRFPEPLKVWNFLIMYFLPVKLTITSEVCVINLRQFYGVICLYKKRIIKCALYISTKNSEGITTSIIQILGKMETCILVGTVTFSKLFIDAETTRNCRTLLHYKVTALKFRPFKNEVTSIKYFIPE